MRNKKILVLGKYNTSYLRSQLRGLKPIASSVKFISFPKAYELKGRRHFQSWLVTVCDRYNFDIVILDLAARSYQVEPDTIKKIRKNGTLVLGTAFDTSTDFQFYLESYAYSDGVICTSPLLRYSFDSVGIPSVLFWPTTRIPIDDLDLDVDSNRDIDVCFIGALKSDRRRWIDALEDHGIKVTRAGWGNGIDDLEYYQLLSRSKIVLNFNTQNHHPIVSFFNETSQWKTIPTLRNIETAACGGLCLSQWVPELELMFPKKTIDVFSSVEELASKIQFYLENPKVRKRMAQLGQQHALSQLNDSSSLSRCVEILSSENAREFSWRGVHIRDSSKVSKVYLMGRLFFSLRHIAKFLRAGRYAYAIDLVPSAAKDLARLNMHVVLFIGYLLLRR